MATNAVDVSKVTGEKPPNKKPRIESECEIINEECSIHDNIKDLSLFKVEKVLFNNAERKSVCLQGRFSSLGGTGLVLLEKTAFEEKNLTKEDSDYFSSKCLLKKIFHNDIYGNYEYFPVSSLSAIKATIIHPATEKHIQKFSVENSYMIDETSKIYNEITLPHILQGQFDLQWVYNILEHKSETERIVFEDSDPTDGFILVPDLKWDGVTLETLYLIAIVHQRKIKSLRDLNETHLKLLKNIRDKGSKAIDEKYGLNSSQLRIYLHYQPSFYHLHVHFTYLKYEAPGILAERSHLLSNVISNIELLPEYYKKITLPFVVRENDNLFKQFAKAGLLTEKCANKLAQ